MKAGYLLQYEKEVWSFAVSLSLGTNWCKDFSSATVFQESKAQVQFSFVIPCTALLISLQTDVTQIEFRKLMCLKCLPKQ